MPALAYGFLDHARKAAQFNTEQLSQHLNEVDMILSFEPTATLCLQREYKYLIDDPRLDAIADKVRDGSDFLRQLYREKALKSGLGSSPMTVAYHCPCHLRMLQIGEPGFELLSLINGLKVDHLINSCCGLAGTFGMNKEKYDASAAIGQGLKENILKGNYTALVSDCSSCRMQLNHLSGLPTFHPIQLLARWYDGK
jgi:glycerol-3-phosphate dehydrogenase subunit C